MELSQLRYFLKLCEERSFTRAAAELGLSQSALSRSIAKLEAELGQPLVERGHRQLELTGAGRAFADRASYLIGLADDAVSELTDREDRGTIRIGAIPTIAPFFLPAVLRDFGDQFPCVQVVVYEEPTDKLLQRCRQGEIDLAILGAPLGVKYLEAETLFEEELLAVLPREHPLAQKPSIELAELRQYPFVLLDETHCLSENIASFCRQRAFQPISIQHTSQLATVEELVALGHGVSLIPQMARDLDTSEQRVYRRVTHPRPTRTVVVVWNPYRFQSRRVGRMREVLQGHAPRAEAISTS
jgi:LysR family hydrogen peroxide-inducible transcriptional activator